MKKLVKESLFEDMSRKKSSRNFKNMSQKERDEALIQASKNGNIKEVKLLLDAGADVHTYNDEALRRASKNKQFEVVKLLKQYMNK